MTRSRLQLRRLQDSRPRRWPDRPLKRKRLRRRPPNRKRRLLPGMRRRRSRKSWLEGGKKRRKTERDRRLRLPDRDKLKNRRPVPSNRNSRLLSLAISSEKMMSLSNSSAARAPPQPGTRRKTMTITSSSR
jgi:hypothetical protein